MAIDKKLIFWKKQSTFNAPSSTTDTTGSVMWYSIVFFKDTGQIWTNGTYYNCGIWGTPQTNYVPLTIGGTSYNLSRDGHTHDYLPLSGGTISNSSTQSPLVVSAPGMGNYSYVQYNNGPTILGYLGMMDVSTPSFKTSTGTVYSIWHAGNSNISTVDWAVKNLTMSEGRIITPNYLQVNTDFGYAQFGPQNPSHCHIYTDRPSFYFNKDILINGNSVWHSGNDGAGSGLDADLIDGINSNNIVYGTNGYACNNIINADFNTINKSGLYTIYGGANSPTGSNQDKTYSLLSILEGSLTGSQLAYSFYGSDSGNLYVRGALGGSFSAWRKIWHEGNFNPSNYLPLSGGTLSGNLHLTQPSWIIFANGQSIRDNGGGGLIIDGVNTIYLAAATVLANGNTVWDSGNDGAGSGLDADLLDGVHYQNILERRHSGSSASGTATGWFRIGALLESNADGHNCILKIKRNYDYADNESYVFSISSAYNGGISITQLSGYANSRLIDKIRIDYTNSGVSYIELHIATSTTNNSYGWTTIGQATSYTTWTAVSDTPVGISYEFTTVNGCKSDRGFTGNLSGNSSSATKLQTTRTIWGQSFNGEGDVTGDLKIGSANAFGISYSPSDTNIYNYFYGGSVFNLKVGEWTAGNVNVFNIETHNGGTAKRALSVMNNGYVGINTTGPAYELDVNGSFRSMGNGYINGVLRNIYEGDPLTGTIVSKSLAYNSSPFGLITRIYSTGVVSLQSQRESSDSETFSLSLNPLGGNVGIGTTSPSYKLDVNGTGRFTGNVTAPTFVGNLTGNASTATQTAANVAAGGTHNLLYSLMADNDYFRVMVGGTSNGGYAEISTGDDGNEPIYVRQYIGHFDQLLRTATLLDENGNTSFPGTVTAPTFYGALSGNATSATILKSVNVTSSSNSVWNPQSLIYQAWGQKFVHTAISGDSGDICYWLRPSQYVAGNTELCVVIDGDYYAGTGAYKVIHSGSIGSQSVNYATSSSYQIAAGASASDWVANFQATPAHSTSFREMSAGGPSGAWWFMQNFRHSNGSNYWGRQIAWGWEDNAHEMYSRNITSGTFSGWVRFLNSSNYNSFSPTLTGGGASGTWGINISGNSATANTASRTSGISGYTHAGTGMYAFYNWGGSNGGTSAPNDSTFTIGISVGSHPGDQSYGFQIGRNMWNTGLWTRGYDSDWGTWYRILDSGNYSSYSPTLIGGGASGTWDISITGNASTATRLVTNYVGGQQLNPQTYFNNEVGLKVAMTGSIGYWNDTLWINGYSGGDVLSMCALHTSRQGTPRMWITSQNSNSTTYGTLYEFVSTYNYSSLLDGRYRPMGGGWSGNSVPGTREFGFVTNDGSGEVAFKSNSGTMNMIIDGEIYCTDSSHKVWHAGNFDSKYTKDTGWITLSVGSSFTGSNLYVRQVGRLVMVEGYLTSTLDVQTADLLLTTLPTVVDAPYVTVGGVSFIGPDKNSYKQSAMWKITTGKQLYVFNVKGMWAHYVNYSYFASN